MGKKDKSKKKSKNSDKRSPKEAVKKSMLEAVEAMSSSDEGSVDKNNKAWNAKAAALEKLIKDGVYDKLADKKNAESDDESVEEVVLGDESESEVEEEEKTTEQIEKKKSKNAAIKEIKDGKDSDVEEEESDEESDDDSKEGLFDLNSKALLAKTEELRAEKKGFPWAEKFEIIPSTPLPFGTVDPETGVKIDVHDDLKREVAFYDIAMEAVEEARTKCKENGIPFSRPDDFFAGECF
jgi:rRNA-processing protein EBP2